MRSRCRKLCDPHGEADIVHCTMAVPKSKSTVLVCATRSSGRTCVVLRVAKVYSQDRSSIYISGTSVERKSENLI